MVKVVSTARRADAVRCIGCGINGQLQRGYSCRAQMAMTFNCHGPQGSRRSFAKLSESFIQDFVLTSTCILSVMHLRQTVKLVFCPAYLDCFIKFQVQLISHHVAGEWLKQQSLTVKSHDHLWCIKYESKQACKSREEVMIKKLIIIINI